VKTALHRFFIGMPWQAEVKKNAASKDAAFFLADREV
jgi:hypothetical protein